MKGTGSGGARGDRGAPEWGRTRASWRGNLRWSAPSAPSRPPAPDGLDGLRLGRPRVHMSRKVLLALSVLMLVMQIGLLILRWVRPRSSEPWPSLADGVAVLMISMGAGFLASCRCERDVHAGRLARWAYGWDWAHVVLLLAAGSLLLWVGSRAALAFAGVAGAHLVIFGRQAWLRRRRALAAWTSEAVDDTFA